MAHTKERAQSIKTSHLTHHRSEYKACDAARNTHKPAISLARSLLLTHTPMCHTGASAGRVVRHATAASAVSMTALKASARNAVAGIFLSLSLSLPMSMSIPLSMSLCVCVHQCRHPSRISPFPFSPSPLVDDSSHLSLSLLAPPPHNIYTPPPLHASLSNPDPSSLPSLRNSSRHLAPHATILARSLSLSLSLSLFHSLSLCVSLSLSIYLSVSLSLSHSFSLSLSF